MGEYDTNMMPVWISSLVTILQLVLYISTAWGLYLINKKLGEKYAWLAFVPIIQIYSYFSASKKSSFYYFWLPIILFFVSTFLAPFTYFISFIAFYIYIVILIILLLHAISKRTGRGAWSTVGLVFVPFIMFPVIGYKLKESDIKKENTDTEANSNDEDEKKDEVVEL